MAKAFLFPGQGSQKLGMLSAHADNPIVQQTFELALKAIGVDLWEVSQTDEQGLINQTHITQPLLLTASIALWKLADLNDVDFLAGHSLGEFSALVAAGALDFEDAVKLVHARGQFMQEAVEQGKGKMAAILGLDSQAVVALCSEAAQGQILSAVNFNSPLQTVIAGEAAAVERACLLAKEKGAKRALELPVSVPSHCALMKPAAEQLATLLASVDIQAPKIPVIHNTSVESYDSPEQIKHALVEQLYSPVRWVETLEYFEQQGVSEFTECGPGAVLVGLGKRMIKAATWQNVEAIISQ